MKKTTRRSVVCATCGSAHWPGDDCWFCAQIARFDPERRAALLAELAEARAAGREEAVVPPRLRLPVTIVALTQTCGAFPAQWEGETSDGAAVYVRYRSGSLRVHLGPSVDAALDRPPIFRWDEGDPMDGEMDLDELKATLPDWIVIEGG